MPERLVLEGFEPFVGKHCETSALKRVLDYHGLPLSEEMLLGLGGENPVNLLTKAAFSGMASC